MQTISFPARSRQSGVVLYVAMVVLFIMTLASFALTRSVTSGAQAASNLAFQQGATAQVDIAFQAATNWLKTRGSSILVTPPASAFDANLPGYSASRLVPTTATDDPVATDRINWRTCNPPALLDHVFVCAGGNPGPLYVDPDGTTGALVAGDWSVDGYRSSYFIQRQCQIVGVRMPNIQAGTIAGNGCDYKNIPVPGSNPPDASFYSIYKITVRVEGPRNTVSFYQSILY